MAEKFVRSIWDEWLEKNDPAYGDYHPDQIKTMWRMYGKNEAHRCGECAFLERRSQSGTWFKCLNTKITGGAATDFKKKWAACGKFQQKEQ